MEELNMADVRRMVMASMETGNPERARTLIRELTELNPQQAALLRADVAAAYGQDI